ncbi:Glutamine transport ATP-binding protein GlnQ [Serratia rubidaea]|uniref:Glutamine transport ATP-binding protein GlnQ n=1 Tax=Serratia rubidaea TaxID=61652 RepID=A0A3S4JY00_SERRU|nr:Glutamine transport ATP-binding protein GlnQ [Serratia rubidaea]
MPLITINQVQKYYGDNHVLKGVDLDIAMGEVVSIIGRSGSGKSTLLRCINGLEGYQEGSIKLGGMTITDRDAQAREISRSVGMVFQSFNLFPHMTALENVMLAPRRVLKKSAAECRELAVRMLEKVGLGDRLDFSPPACPAASSSGWRSPARWRCRRRCCCAMKLPQRWIRSWSARC